MEKVVLKSMTDFVLEQLNLLKNGTINILQFRNALENNVKFLKQELNIGMFVPAKLVNGEWAVLKDPGLLPSFELNEFRSAKNNVLFEGFSISENNENNVSNAFFEINLNSFCFSKIEENGIVYGMAKNIEQLVEWNIILTESAKQKIFNT